MLTILNENDLKKHIFSLGKISNLKDLYLYFDFLPTIN